MKQDWELKKLGEVASIKHGFAFKGKSFINSEDEKFPIVLTPGNFKENGTLVFSRKNTKRCISKYENDFKFEVGDLVVVMTDLSSKMKILGSPAIIYSNNILHNQRIGKFIFHSEINKNFLRYFMLTNYYSEQIKRTATGTMVKHTAPKRILEMEIPIPPLPEQKRIVAILDEAFAAIDKAKANAEKNLANAKELFDSYLNKIFSNPGEDWEEKKLGEVCEKIFAGGDKPKNYSKVGTAKHTVPIYANGEKNKGLFGFTDIPTVNQPSITISARGTIGYSEIRKESYVPIVRLIVLFPKIDDIEIKYLHYGLKRTNFVNSGTSIPQLTVPMVKEYDIPVPSIPAQKQIVQKLDRLSSETENLANLYKQKIDELEELKKSVLQKAFEGEL